MCTAVSFLSDNHYFGRNLDLEHRYKEAVTITPRSFPFHFRTEEIAKRDLQPFAAVFPARGHVFLTVRQIDIYKHTGLIWIHTAAKQQQAGSNLFFARDFLRQQRTQEFVPAKHHHVSFAKVIV